MQSEGPGRGRKGRRKGPIVPTKGRGIAGKEVPIGYRMNGDSNMLTISGGNDEGVPPVPIPNTEVKPYVAEDTLESSLGKNTKLPTFFYIPQ